MKTVYLNPNHFEPHEYEIELNCPYCGKTFTWLSYEIIFQDETIECEHCEKEFLAYSQP